MNTVSRFFQLLSRLAFFRFGRAVNEKGRRCGPEAGEHLFLPLLPSVERPRRRPARAQPRARRGNPSRAPAATETPQFPASPRL